MHLGLYSRARKDLAEKEKHYAHIMARRAKRKEGSGDDTMFLRRPSRSPSPIADAHARLESHSPTHGTPAVVRASSGSPTTRNRPPSTSKAAQKLHSAIDHNDHTGAFMESQLEAINQELRASAEGGWNSSTNNNVLNSTHNNKGVTERPHSAYDARRTYTPAYNKVLDSVAQSKDGSRKAEHSEKMEKARPKSSSGIGRSESKKASLFAQSKQEKQEKAAAESTARPTTPKAEFTLYDVKEKTREFFHYPAGSFRSNGDLIDFQALAVQQSVKFGNAKPRPHSAKHPSAKPEEVFPGVENGPEWVRFQRSEALTRSYTEETGLISPVRATSANMKKLSAMRKNVSFGANSNTKSELNVNTGLAYGERAASPKNAPSPKSMFSPLVSPKSHSPQSRLTSPKGRQSPAESRKAELLENFDAAAFVEPARAPTPEPVAELATSQVPFGHHSGKNSPSRASPVDPDTSYLSEEGEEEEKEADDVSKVSVSSEEPEKEINHAIRGLHVKSHSGLDTRSSSIFHKIEIAPRVIGNPIEDLMQLGGSYYVPDLFEVSVFDVGYVLPCSNNTIQFTTKQSVDNAMVLTQKDRTRMRMSFIDLGPSLLVPGGAGTASRHGSAKSAKPYNLLSGKTQFPGETLSIKVQSADDPYLPTTYGLLVEVIAKPQGPNGSSSTAASPHPHHAKFATSHPPSTNGNRLLSPIARSVSEDHQSPSSAGSRVQHQHYHRHNPATYAYKLIPLRELLDIALKSDNDEMCTLLNEMLHFGYRFGQTNNPNATSPIQRVRMMHRSQCEEMGDAPPPDHILFNDQADVIIYPCMFNMLDRHIKRSLSILIKSNLEVLFNTDLQRVSVGIKY